jgi:hypothetical protein
MGCRPPVTVPVSPASCPRDAVVLASPADIARLARCTTLAGVTIRTGAALDVSALHALTSIAGDLVIGPTVAIDDVALDGLRVVDGAVRVVGNGLLQRVRLPGLARAGRLEINGNPVLSTVSLPRLAEVRGSVQVIDNANLELLDVPALASIGEALELTGDPSLSMIEAGALRTTGSVELELGRLPPDQAEQLRATAAP